LSIWLCVQLQIREKEANVDNLINPIEDMYSLLMRYEVRVPKEETDMVGDLRYSWKKLRKLSTDVSDNLARLQVHLHHLLLGSLTFTLLHLLTAIICIQIALSLISLYGRAAQTSSAHVVGNDYGQGLKQLQSFSSATSCDVCNC